MSDVSSTCGTTCNLGTNADFRISGSLSSTPVNADGDSSYINPNISGNISGKLYYTWWPYPGLPQTVWYSYPVDQSERIATLEGEVAVLREMVTALIGKPKPSRKRKTP